MSKSVYFITRITKEAVYQCRRKAICTLYELGTDKALAHFTSDPFWAERQALEHIEEHGWRNVSYNAETGTVTGLAKAKIEELTGNTIASLKKLFAKKIAGTIHERLTSLKYTINGCDEHSQTVSFVVTARLKKKSGSQHTSKKSQKKEAPRI